jgi:hypothetical protein
MYLPSVLAEGKVLYRDVWFNFGPASPYFNSWLFRLFGVHLNVLYWAGSLSALASAILLCLCGMRLSSAIAGWTAGAVLLFEAFHPTLFSFSFAVQSCRSVRVRDRLLLALAGDWRRKFEELGVGVRGRDRCRHRFVAEIRIWGRVLHHPWTVDPGAGLPEPLVESFPWGSRGDHSRSGPVRPDDSMDGTPSRNHLLDAGKFSKLAGIVFHEDLWQGLACFDRI